MSAALGRRSRFSAAVVRGINRASRALGRGSGTVIGGRAGLLLDPGLLGELAGGRRTALVSGTNGKTTTTRLLAAAVESRLGPVAINATGANMPAGHVAALAERPGAAAAVLEVDEGYLDQLLTAAWPAAAVLLNLSRDQLDRVAEVRLLAARWREALGSLPDAVAVAAGAGRPAPPVVVANADDPLVAWAASAAPSVRWVGAGLVWRQDAVGCPACGGRVVYSADGRWACDRCELRRPGPDAWLEGDDLVASDGSRLRLALQLPGRFNMANAAMAGVAACLLLGEDGRSMGTPAAEEALGRMASVASIEGRFATVVRGGRRVRLVLAKNPAGWAAVLDLLEDRALGGPLVLSINARTADGHDPSWLWDVPFERLAGRRCMATGDRRRDLAVRLRYAEVEHEVVDDPIAALERASDPVPAGRRGSGRDPSVVFVGNYTAFADVRRRLA